MALEAHNSVDAERSARSLQKAGAIASLLMAVSLPVAAWIYLTGDINSAVGVFGYSVADLLFGPVFGASLVTVIAALRERMRADAPRRMQMAQLAAALAAGAFVLMACIRAANRQYFLATDRSDLLAWSTLVAGVNGAAWHFLGWAYVLVAWAGWTSRQLPRVLSGLYLVAGAAALFVYQWANILEAHAGFFTLVVSIWVGVVLLRAGRASGSGD